MRSQRNRSLFLRFSACLLGAVVASLPARGATRLGTLSVSGENGSTLDVPVGITSSDSVSCVQFDLVYDPARLTLGAARTGDGAPNHQVGSTIVSAGRERVVLYSTSLAPLDGGYVVKVPATWLVTGASGVSVDSVKLVTAGGGSVTLTSTDLAPQVVSTPTQPKVVVGGSTTLTVEVSGLGTIEYQWYLNDVAIAGATSASYTVSNASDTNGGAYSVRVHTAAGDTTTTPFTLTIALPSRLLNISTRAVVKTGANVLIPGFAVRGDAGSLKRVLVRAVGPRLQDLGLPAIDLLADPVLTLTRSVDSGPPVVVATNDDWVTSPDVDALLAAETQVGAFHLDGRSDVPTPGVYDTKSAALLTDLAPGNYTAVSSGKNDSTGIAIVEVYDVSGENSRMINVSNRGYVGAGAQVMIPGFFIHGDVPAQFLIRGVGPGLTPFGIPAETVLNNPRIRVVKSGNPAVDIAQNDDWDKAPNDSATILAAAAKVGAFGLAAGGNDACLLVTLDPGIYTVVCESADGGTGTALVEVYQVP